MGHMLRRRGKTHTASRYQPLEAQATFRASSTLQTLAHLVEAKALHMVWEGTYSCDFRRVSLAPRQCDVADFFCSLTTLRTIQSEQRLYSAWTWAGKLRIHFDFVCVQFFVQVSHELFVDFQPPQQGENCVPQENVLIIQEKTAQVPDASFDGGMILFEFEKGEADIISEIEVMNVKGRDSYITVLYRYVLCQLCK